MILYRVFNIIYRNPLVFKLSKLYKIESNALQVMHQFTDDVIRKRRTELLIDKGDNNSNNDGGDDAITGDDIGMRKKRALLDILLHSTIDDKPLTDLDIREEVDNFMFAVSLLFMHLKLNKIDLIRFFCRATTQQHQLQHSLCIIWQSIQRSSKNVSTKSVMYLKRIKINHQLFMY